jgi:hypothetical protein
LTGGGKAEVASVRMKLNKEQSGRLMERVAEAARELGILWLVFSLLDRLVAGTFTLPWAMVNGLVALAAWSFGLYIESRGLAHGS